MGQRYIRQKLKALGAFIFILILLPYVISVFVNGADEKEDRAERVYVRVKIQKDLFGTGDGAHPQCSGSSERSEGD